MAQSTDPETKAPNGDDVEEVEVVGTRDEDISGVLGQPADYISGDDLRLKLSSTIGETIATEAGVHNASFGPGVGLPVLRGLSGVRVRVSEGGIGAWDGSTISPDHASTVEAVLADRVEIVRGPSTLRNGSSAIGGVVNVETNRTHSRSLDDPFHSSVETRYEVLNHNQRTVAAKLDLQMSKFIVHVDGFHREHGDVDIPGMAIDEQAVAEQFFFNASQDNTDGFIANTDAEAYGGAAGISYIADNGYLGFSVSQLDNNYGIPPGAHTEPLDAGPDHVHLANGIGGSPDIRIDLAQTRYDFNAGRVFERGPLSAIDLQIGEVDYQHVESEEGAAGTLFESDVTEMRVSIEHAPIFGLTGEFGVHRVDKFFAAVGAESFIPPSDTELIGAFLIERLQLDEWTLEAGVRVENVTVTQLEPTAPLRPNLQQFMHDEIDYDLFSFSAGLTYAPDKTNTFSLLLGQSARAPDVQELLALGPHLATRSFTIGSLIRGQHALNPETFNSIDLGWQYQGAAGNVSVEVFYTEADDFVFQNNTGVFYDLSEQFFRFNCARIEECLPVYEYEQANATLQGVEWRWEFPQWALGEGQLGVELFGDRVRGRLKSGEDLPRMPPQRWGIGANWTSNSWATSLRVTHAVAQRYPGLNETETPAYTDLSGNISYVMAGPRDGRTLFFVRGKNLMDEQIRHAASFLRNFAPEPGRTVEVGLRFDY
ncbi:MAG: TonB-dependent receptor [Pseudomonadota bacterium]